MQIVIDITEKLYKALKQDDNEGDAWDAVEAIINGTPLPKGHGRLIDEKEILNNPDGIYYDIYDLPEYLEECIPTVIEADKEVHNADSN